MEFLFVMNILLEKPLDFKSLKEFKKNVSSYKDINPKCIKDGFLYSFDYDYAQDVDFDILQYYDWFPLSLIFTIKDSNHCFGINFHRCPLLTRNWLISRIKGMNTNAFSKDGYNKVKINYSTLKSLMNRVPYMVRQYRMDRMTNLKMIKTKDWGEMVKYQPNTFHSANFIQMVKKYNASKPKKNINDSFSDIYSENESKLNEQIF